MGLEREFFIDNIMVRIHFIIVMIRWTGLAPWEFEFPFPGSLTSTFQGCGAAFCFGRNGGEGLGLEIEDQLLHRNVQRFRGGLVFKAHRLCVSLTFCFGRDGRERVGLEIEDQREGDRPAQPGKPHDELFWKRELARGRST